MCVIDKGVQVSGERDAGTCSAEAAQLVTVTSQVKSSQVELYCHSATCVDI